jgi:hypothetical protein
LPGEYPSVQWKKEIGACHGDVRTGPAIETRIFEVFAQLKPTPDRKECGRGIGLALAKKLHLRAPTLALGRHLIPNSAPCPQPTHSPMSWHVRAADVVP